VEIVREDKEVVFKVFLIVLCNLFKQINFHWKAKPFYCISLLQ